MSDDIRKGQDLSVTHEQGDTSSTDNNNANLSRRKFTKVGLFSAPVIMTLASRPVMGSGGHHGGGGHGGDKAQCTVSGILSGNLSQPDKYEHCVCKPKYSCKKWKTDKSKWSGAGCKSGKIEWVYKEPADLKDRIVWGGDGTKCSEIFGAGTNYHDNETMMHVLWKADEEHSDPYKKKSYKLTAAAIAAWCNARAYPSEYGLSEDAVKRKYWDALANNYENYFTKAGDDCVTALKKEFDYLNCEADAEEDYFDHEHTDDHWVKDYYNNAYEDCKEFYAYKSYKKDKGSPWGMECNSWGQFKTDYKGKRDFRRWKRTNDSDHSEYNYHRWDHDGRRWCK